jgi:hypothetical protein
MLFRNKFAMTMTACLLASVACAPMAIADGSPKTKKVTATPLDQAIQELENKEPPVAVAPEPEPAPAIEQDEPVVAETPPPVPESRIVEVQPNTSFFGLSVGLYDPTRNHQHAPAFNAEFQPGTKIAGFLQPLFGAMVTTDGTMFGYGGVGVPFHLGERIFVMPSVAVGAYKEGAGHDLGQTLAYRAGAEIAYEFDDKSRFGINAHMISNGHSLDKNDYTGIVALTYTVPVGMFSGEAPAELAQAE